MKKCQKKQQWKNKEYNKSWKNNENIKPKNNDKTEKQLKKTWKQ